MHPYFFFKTVCGSRSGKTNETPVEAPVEVEAPDEVEAPVDRQNEIDELETEIARLHYVYHLSNHLQIELIEERARTRHLMVVLKGLMDEKSKREERRGFCVIA